MLKKSKKDPKIILESEKMTLSWENIDVNIPTATGGSYFKFLIIFHFSERNSKVRTTDGNNVCF